MKRIVIIGGGFSGILVAINLIRLSNIPLSISIIDKTGTPGRGVPYRTSCEFHLLNVVARNMSALADQPHHFVEWLRTRSEYLDEPLNTLREKFIPRRIYGDYIQNLFQWYAGPLAESKGIQIDFIHDEAEDIVLREDALHVVLDKGQPIRADKIVLALGNQAPGHLPVAGLNYRSAKYIGNPWIGHNEKLPSREMDLLLVGTGLTMVDAFLSLKKLGWRGKIIAVSRHGLLPLSHFKGVEYPDFLDDTSTTQGLRKLFALFKQHYRAARVRNLNPAILIDKFRPFTQRIWQHFTVFEKRQFIRHFRTRWNVMRHRIAAEIHDQLMGAILEGRLEIIRGRLREAKESERTLAVAIETNGTKRWIEVGALINCTGPLETCSPAESRLFDNLFSSGLIQPDEMNMGLKVAPDFAVIQWKDTKLETIFALGNLQKGTLWETTAVPELRSQALRLAEIITAQLSENLAVRHFISEIVEEVLEYSI